MAALLQTRKTEIIAVTGTFAVSAIVGCPRNISVLLSSAVYGLLARSSDLDFVAPFILGPLLSKNLKKYGSTIDKRVYALSMAYLIWSWSSESKSKNIPKNVLLFLDKHHGFTRSELKEYRTETDSNNGWPSKTFTSSVKPMQIMTRSARRLITTIGKMIIFQVILQMIIARRIKLDLKGNASDLIRSVMFMWFAFQGPTQGVLLYNKVMNKETEKETDKDEEEECKPDSWKVLSYFALCAYIAIHFQSKRKMAITASCVSVQAILTLLHQKGINIKILVPLTAMTLSRKV